MSELVALLTMLLAAASQILGMLSFLGGMIFVMFITRGWA